MSKLLLSTDEFTLTIFPTEKCNFADWEYIAEGIVDDFIQCTLLEQVFVGQKSCMMDRLPAGYTTGYDMGLKDFYFSIAYNANKPDMCVCIRFSAKSWAVYQSRFYKMYGTQVTVPVFLHMVQDHMDNEIRLSRIDFVADFYDFDICLDDLYADLKNEDVLIQDKDGIRRIKRLDGFEFDAHAATIYIGSRKKNSRGFLRIYDKKKEQLDSNGFRLQEALEHDEWVRFEAVFRGAYAHEITKRFLEDNMDFDTYIRFIAFSIAEKYRLYDVRKKCYLPCTEQLVDLISTANFNHFRIESPRDNALSQNIRHLEHGSGLYPTLYKIEKTYGKDAVTDFINHLMEQFKSGSWMSNSMYKDLSLWLKKHADLKDIRLEDNY